MKPTPKSTPKTWDRWIIFYFLWGDPLFSEPFDKLKTWVDDDFIDLRRTLVLTALDYFGTLRRLAQENYAEVQKLKQIIHESQWREWQLLKSVSAEVAEKLWVEFNVNKLDPDFSFDEWAKQYDAEIEAQRRERGKE